MTFLNSERSKVRQKQQKWQTLVKSQQMEVDTKCQEIKERLGALEAEHDKISGEHMAKMKEFEEQHKSLNQHIEEAKSSEKQVEEHYVAETARLQEASLIQSQLDQAMLQDIQNRRNM